VTTLFRSPVELSDLEHCWNHNDRGADDQGEVGDIERPEQAGLGLRLG
jgi:hypothetical protein